MNQFETMTNRLGRGGKRVMHSLLALALSMMISACLIIEIEITESVEAGGDVTLRIVVQENFAEGTTPHKGVQIVTVPADWVFKSGTYTADDMNGAVGSGTLSESAAWADSATIGLGPAPAGFKHMALISDMGYIHADTLIAESTILMTAGQTAGEFTIGITVTKEAYFPSNGDWFATGGEGSLNGADSTTTKTTVTGGGPIAITLDQLNHIPQADLDSLADLGADMTIEDYTYLILPQDLIGEVVSFTAVVASDPFSSGRASFQNDRVNRIHVLLVDTTANGPGMSDADAPSMWSEVVDGDWENTGTLDLLIGDVINVIADVAFFNQSLNIEPISYEVIGTMADFGLSPDIMKPIVVQSGDLNIAVEGGFQGNVKEWSRLGKRYVKLEGATVTSRIISNNDEPHMALTTDGGATSVEFSNSSILYRNDQGSYPDEFNHRGEDWVPPPPGSVVNYTGYAIAQGDIRLTTSVPRFAQINLMPWEISDIEILASPPQVGDPVGPTAVPGEDPVTVTVDVVSDSARTISGVALNYLVSPDDSTVTSVAMTNTSGNTWSGEIPGQPDGSIVRYSTLATDSEGAEGASISGQYRVLVDGVNSIADIQETFDRLEGDSPLKDFTTPMDIWAVVQSRSEVSGMLSVQDSPDLAAWSGIHLGLTDAITAMGLVPGDSVHVTAGTIEEENGVPGFDSENHSTRISDATVEKGGSTAALGYLDVTSAEMTETTMGEAYESMLVNFPSVVITDNKPNDFGDWNFKTRGTELDLFGEDASPGFIGGGDDNFETGMGLEFLRGFWTQAFGTYRLLPEDNDDVGAEVATAIEPIGEGIPAQFALEQNYPNPFNPSTSINYALKTSSHVKLQVFDVTGQLVETLVDDFLGAGNYRVTFEAGNLASGIYLYRMQAGGNVITNRMLLLK
jgi:hypothetical protein